MFARILLTAVALSACVTVAEAREPAASGYVDLDGDGAGDRLYRERGWWYWEVRFASGEVGIISDGRADFGAGQRYRVGDFNGDGRPDLAWKRPGDSDWQVAAWVRTTRDEGAAAPVVDARQVRASGQAPIRWAVAAPGRLISQAPSPEEGLGAN